MVKFNKIVRVVWILASKNGWVLAHGHPDPKMPPYHLDSVAYRLPPIVSAPNKDTLGDARREWNDRMRRSSATYKVKGGLLVHERRVRITIEEA